MSQDPEQYPHVDVGDHQPELCIRDFYMFNYHINSGKMKWLKGVIDIIDAHRRMFDFCEALDDGVVWNVDTVETGQGAAATYTCTDLVNGVLLLSTGDTEDDNIEVSRLCECWKLVDCYPLYAEIRFKISDVDASEFWFGFVTGNNFFTPPDDFLVFKNDGADDNLEIENATNGVGNETLTGQTLSDNTWYRLGLHWDGAGTVRWFVIADGDAPQTILATGQITTYIVQDEELSIGFGIQTGEAVAKLMYIDYIKVCQKRVIE